MSNKIVITGASGLIATELTMLLLQQTDYELILISRSVKDLEKRYHKWENRIRYCTLDSILHEIPDYDAVIHTAFARSSSAQAIAESLYYLTKLCKWVKGGEVKKFINISSQSVYGNDYPFGIDEGGKCTPDYPYALGKYASELIADASFSSSQIELFNLRLSSVCENARFVRVFVDNVLKGSPIRIVAPEQKVSFIDVRDVADALYCILKVDGITGGTFNLGTGERYSILEVAQRVNRIGVECYHLSSQQILIEDNGCRASVGMNVSLFQETFKWKAKYSLDLMIKSIFEMLTDVNGGGYPIAFKIVYGL